ncbi:MAG: hypothetical protein KKH98_05105 [Spirochaetes bacterium]|nr:hypothetical protein [Spirochaetota bacterium]
MKKKTRQYLCIPGILFLVFIFLSSSVSLIPFNSFNRNAMAGTLDNFKEDVEKEEKEKKEEKKKKEAEEKDDDCFSSCFSTFFSEFTSILIRMNQAATYSDYPYAERNRNWISLVFPDEPSGEGVAGKEESPKKYFINLDLGVQNIDSATSSWYLGIQSRFWGMFGLLIDYKVYKEASDYLALHGYGLDFPFIQLGSFDFSFYVQYAIFNNSLSRNGFGFGGMTHIFPVKPLSIFFKLGGISCKDISFWDWEIDAGFMLSRFEVYIGYQEISAKYAKLGGIQSGIRVWF